MYGDLKAMVTQSERFSVAKFKIKYISYISDILGKSEQVFVGPNPNMLKAIDNDLLKLFLDENGKFYLDQYFYFDYLLQDNQITIYYATDKSIEESAICSKELENKTILMYEHYLPLLLNYIGSSNIEYEIKYEKYFHGSNYNINFKKQYSKSYKLLFAFTNLYFESRFKGNNSMVAFCAEKYDDVIYSKAKIEEDKEILLQIFNTVVVNQLESILMPSRVEYVLEKQNQKFLENISGKLDNYGHIFSNLKEAANSDIVTVQNTLLENNLDTFYIDALEKRLEMAFLMLDLIGKDFNQINSEILKSLTTVELIVDKIQKVLVTEKEIIVRGENKIDISLIQEPLFIIIFNLMSNAIRHSVKNSIVEIGLGENYFNIKNRPKNGLIDELLKVLSGDKNIGLGEQDHGPRKGLSAILININKFNWEISYQFQNDKKEKYFEFKFIWK